MKVNSVIELEDRSVKFEGELSPTEAALVVAFGLNTMFSVGLTSMLPGLETEEFDVEEQEELDEDPSNRH